MFFLQAGPDCLNLHRYNETVGVELYCKELVLSAHVKATLQVCKGPAFAVTAPLRQRLCPMGPLLSFPRNSAVLML